MKLLGTKHWRHKYLSLTIPSGLAVAVLLALLTPPSPNAAAGTSTDYAVVAGASGDPMPSASGSGALSTSMNQPSALAVDAQGNVVIADTANSRIELLARSSGNPGYVLGGLWSVGNLYLLAGGGSDVPGPATAALLTRLDQPRGVAIDSGGNILIADSGHNEVELLAESSANPGYDIGGDTWTRGDLYVVAGSGSTAPSAGGSLAVSDLLNDPTGVAVAGSIGNIVIADNADNEIEIVAESPTNTGFPALPASLTVGNLYVIAGASATVHPDACGVSAESVTLNRPSAVAEDSNGDIILSDSNDNDVEVLATASVNPLYELGAGSSWTVGDDYVIAGTGSHANGSSCPLSAGTSFSDPIGVGVDQAGDVIVADAGGQLVWALASSTTDPGYSSASWRRGVAQPIVGGGSNVASGSGTDALATSLSEPEGVGLASDGSVYVADAGTNDVEQLTIAPNVVANPAISVGDGRAAIQWSAPQTDGGLAISGYVVTEFVGSSMTPATTFSAAGTSYDVTGLTDGTTYGFTVAAINSIGTGTASPEVYATPMAPVVTTTTLPPSTNTGSGSSTGSSGSSTTTTTSPPPQTPVSSSPASPVSTVSVGAMKTKPATKASKSPSIRLSTPSAVISSRGVLLPLICSGICRGEAEISETVSVGTGVHRVLETKVLAAAPYHLTSSSSKIRLVLTSAGRSELKTLRGSPIANAIVTFGKGKVLDGRVHIVKAAAVTKKRSTKKHRPMPGRSRTSG